MDDTMTIFVDNGIWYSGYEPHDIPGAWVRTRYSLEVIDGGRMLPNGRHQGMITGERLLCIKSGGEHYAGTIINQNLRNFIITFDEEYHNQYHSGVKRAFKGKRKCSNSYFSRQSETWQTGYKNGLEDKVYRLNQQQTT